jgi:adenylate cyclase
MAATRRLAAILAADVAGYSRLIGADEQRTLERLKEIRAELIEPSVGAHNGRIVKTTGDGLLIEFASTVDALRCAGGIQAQMRERNATLAPDRRIDFRIGVHQGDIVVEDGDIFGDGVNIAARLEALAEPGGICVSARVQEDAAGKLDLAFRDLGEQHLRHIARPVRVYAIDPRLAQTTAAGIAPADPAPRISLVVLPFASLSPDPEQGYFADAVTDDLTTDLSRIADSFVIARTTAFTYKGKAVDVRQVARELGVRYVLEGSVRTLGEWVQVNVQLIDGATGSHVWADRFDTNRRDLAEAQSEVTGRLARTLDAELIRDAGRRIELERAADPGARDLVMRGRALRLQGYSKGYAAFHNPQRDLYERALALDPTSVEARVHLALNLAGVVAEGDSSSIEEDKARAEQLLREALERDPNRQQARTAMGLLRKVQGRWADAQVELEAAIALDRNDAFAIWQLGQIVMIQGKLDAAIPYLEKTIRLDPRAYNISGVYVNLGACHCFLGKIDEAVELLRKARSLAPGRWHGHIWLAAALGLRGDTDEATAEIAETLKLRPDVNSIARLRAVLLTMGWVSQQIEALREKTTYAGLRRAGFPGE